MGKLQLKSKETAKEPAVKTNRYHLIVKDEVVLSTNHKEELLNELFSYQAKDEPQIFLTDDKLKTTTLYSKDRYQKNYRITSSDYPPKTMQQSVPVQTS